VKKTGAKKSRWTVPLSGSDQNTKKLLQPFQNIRLFLLTSFITEIFVTLHKIFEKTMS
jgi:hypothetical protein